MRRQGLRSKVRRKFVVTTDTKHNLKASPNLLNRDFDVDCPNNVWSSDITYLRSRAGWLFLVVFLDLFSRRVVGWCVSTSLGHETVLKALSRAVWQRRPEPGLMIHSDRGIQYCCEGFRVKRRSHRALAPPEQQAVLDLLHCERFMDKAPPQVWAELLDEGLYFCSLSTMYRILKAHEEVRERRNIARRLGQGPGGRVPSTRLPVLYLVCNHSHANPCAVPWGTHRI